MLNDKLKDTTNNLSEKEEENKQLTTTLNSKENEIKKLEEEKTDNENKIEVFKEQVSALTANKEELAAAKKELSDLKTQSSSPILNYVLTAIITFILTLGITVLFLFFKNKNAQNNDEAITVDDIKPRDN